MCGRRQGTLGGNRAVQAEALTEVERHGGVEIEEVVFSFGVDQRLLAEQPPSAAAAGGTDAAGNNARGEAILGAHALADAPPLADGHLLGEVAAGSSAPGSCPPHGHLRADGHCVPQTKTLEPAPKRRDPAIIRIREDRSQLGPGFPHAAEWAKAVRHFWRKRRRSRSRTNRRRTRS